MIVAVLHAAAAAARWDRAPVTASYSSIDDFKQAADKNEMMILLKYAAVMCDNSA